MLLQLLQCIIRMEVKSVFDKNVFLLSQTIFKTGFAIGFLEAFYAFVQKVI